MTSPLRIAEIDHVVLRVRAMAPALDFYVRVLGCEEERRIDDIGLVQLRAGRHLIDLIPRADAGGTPGAPFGSAGRNLEHICLTLETFEEDRLRAFLAAEGIAAATTERRYGARGFGRSFYIADPDGNVIELKAPD